MKYIAVLFAIFIIALIPFLIVRGITGDATVDSNPCRMIDCDVQSFGFYHINATWIDTTQSGYAVCACPQDYGRVFYVSLYRNN